MQGQREGGRDAGRERGRERRRGGYLVLEADEAALALRGVVEPHRRLHGTPRQHSDQVTSPGYESM